MSKILLLGVGGTIAGIAPDPAKDPLSYSAGQVSIEDLVKNIELPNRIDFEFYQLANINSCDLTQDLLSQLGSRINQALIDPEVSGIIVTHGTDTIEETGLFLHLCCGDLAVKQHKVVALTGAMLPSNAPMADGPQNLMLAVKVVAKQIQADRGLDIQGGIVGVFADRIIAARDYLKRSSEAIDAPVCDSSELSSQTLARLRPLISMPIPQEDQWPWVDILMSYSGIDPKVFNFLIESKVAGLIFAGTGQGNIHKNLLDSIAKAKKLAIPMVRASRTGRGQVRQNVGMNDEHLGTLPAGGLAPAQARLVLQLCLYAAYKDKSLDWKKIFATIAG